MNATETILEGIERRIEETNAEIVLLKAARTALVTGASTPAQPADRRRSELRTPASRTGSKVAGARAGVMATAPAAEPALAGGSVRPPVAARRPTTRAAATAIPATSSQPAAAHQPAAAGQTATAERPATAEQPPARRRRGSGTRPAVVPAGKLEVLLAATNGVSTAALAEQAGGRASQVLELLRELERGGKVRRSGARRSTRWHWITDEERIQARAAELKQLTRRGS